MADETDPGIGTVPVVVNPEPPPTTTPDPTTSTPSTDPTTDPVPDPTPDPVPSWTYSGDPSSSPKDALRFAIGDTRKTAPQLTDGEVLACLAAANGNAQAAAVIALRSILMTLGRNRDETVGSVSISFSQQYDHYTALLSQLEGQVGLFGSFTVYAGGISRNDAFNIYQDQDRIPHEFKNRRRHDVPSGSLLAASPQYDPIEGKDDQDDYRP